ncbi:mechanosensitive ion channel family protein [Alteromonas sp. 14N.309.X.WAT.G.H12]|uniref:mechanosensitive ion channel family protein n=1 Tax=Alteromonas sp. 14N.309.X.WAT.G.H12 TaxID=3120824 RepID=UPI002FD6C279
MMADVSVDLALVWQNISDFIQTYKLVASAILMITFLAVKRLVLRLLKRRSKKTGEDRRHSINIIEQLGNAILLILLMMLWASEIQNLAISIAAFMVAIVLATREFIQCFMGFIYYLGARPFRVGDWIQMSSVQGEVVEMDWAKTTLLEVDPESYNYTGKHLYIPNSQLVTHAVRNLNFLRRYTLHQFTLVLEPETNPYALLPQFRECTLAHCEHFREVAGRYKSLIERHMDAEFIDIDPDIAIETNQYAKLRITISLFCPIEEAHELQQKISHDWMDLWHEQILREEKVRGKQKANTR